MLCLVACELSKHRMTDAWQSNVLRKVPVVHPCWPLLGLW
jgi:hypothetical protein